MSILFTQISKLIVKETAPSAIHSKVGNQSIPSFLLNGRELQELKMITLQ